MLGLFGWGMFLGGLFGKAINDNDYTQRYYKSAKAKGDPYYYDAKGRKYMTDTHEQVFLSVNTISGSPHKVIKSVETGMIVRDLTQEAIDESTRKSKQKAIEEGKPVYYDYDSKNRYYTDNVFRSVENDDEMFAEMKIRNHIYYYPLEFDKREGSINKYKRKLDGMYWICSIDPDDKTEKWKRVDWRGYQKIVGNSKCLGHPDYCGCYDDIFKRKIKENGKKYDVVWSCADNLPWAVEYKSYEYPGCGIKGFWRLYEKEDGSFVRERKWYHEGESLKFGKDVIIKK